MNEKNTRKETINKRIVVEEIRRTFDKEYSDNDILIGKLQNILNFSSVTVSIVAAILASAFQGKVGISFWFMVAISLILYIGLVWTILKGLTAGRYRLPITINWNVLDDTYFHGTEDNTLDLIISEHITSIEYIKSQNIQKAELIQRSSILTTAIIVTLLAAVPVGLLLTDSILATIISTILKYTLG
jgi:hypothetical protein